MEESNVSTVKVEAQTYSSLANASVTDKRAESNEIEPSRGATTNSGVPRISTLSRTISVDTPEHYDRTVASSILRSESYDSLSSTTDVSKLHDESDNEVPEDDHGYERVKEVYQKVQDLLTKNEQDGIHISPIREEFGSLWEGIEASHENESRLIHMDRETSAELSSVMAKSKQLIKLAEDDPELAFALGQRLEKIWILVDIGEKDEREMDEKIENLKQDIFELTRNINNAARIEGQESMKELQSIKVNLEKDRDLMNADANKLRSSLNTLFERRQDLFEKRSTLEEKCKLLDQEFTAQSEAILREAGRKERIAGEIEEVRQKIVVKQEELEDLGNSIQISLAKMLDTEKAVYDQRLVNEAANREAEFSRDRIEKLRSDFEHQQRVVERMTMDAYRRSQELKNKEEEVNNLKLELHRATRQRSLNMKKVVSLQQALATLEIERESLKSKISVLEKDLDQAQKKLEENKKKVEELDKQRSYVNRNLKRATTVTTEHANQAKTHEVAVRNLETAVKTYQLEIDGQRHAIFRLEKERDFYSHEATKMAEQVAFQLNEIKKLDIAIFQYRKKLGTLETQLKKTQQIYEIAVYDKNVFERTLRDTITEILENNTKIRHLNNQVSSLKYQVNEKDEIVHREALRYDRILKETDFFTIKARRIQRQAEDIQRQGESLEAERSTLGCSLAEIEGELAKERYYKNAAASQVAVYERKLMAKEIELRNIWDKWRVLHSTIRIGAYHHRAIMREIMQLRYRILSTRKEQTARLKALGNYSRLRHEAAVMANCVSKERCMINALLEQMRHPINIHRWRLLEAISPEAYELVQKINLLTKRLVERNNILQEQKKQLEQKQAMYVEIRACVDRIPGLELAEEVKYYKCLLASKMNQLHSLNGELASAESQTEHYRNAVKILNERMLDLKQQYFDKLRRNQRNVYKNTIQFLPNRRLWTAA